MAGFWIDQVNTAAKRAFGHKPHLRSNPDVFLSRHALLSSAGPWERGVVGTFLYRCPATGLNVQGFGADPLPAAVVCRSNAASALAHRVAGAERRLS